MRRSIKRLTFVTDAPHFGGAERYIIAMAHASKRRRIEPHIHWLPLPGGDVDVFDSARREGLRVTLSECSETGGPLSLTRSLREMLRRERPDGLIINASGRTRFWLASWMSAVACVPCVWVHQMIDGRDHRRMKPRWFGGRVEGLHLWRLPQAIRHRLASLAASGVVALNPDDRDLIIRWQRVPRDKIHVVPHGVDCDRYQFQPQARDALRNIWKLDANAPFVVGTAGRLVDGKRVDLLIDAVMLLRERGVPVQAVIAGQGPARDELVAHAEANHVAEHVRFIDFVEDMPAFYSALDAFVLCSNTESFGLVLAEAMSCERAVIATPTLGARKQIEHQHNGWQLRTFAPAELADALEMLHDDPVLRERYGAFGRAGVIENFSIDLTLERTLRALGTSAWKPSRMRRPAPARSISTTFSAEGVA